MSKQQIVFILSSAIVVMACTASYFYEVGKNYRKDRLEEITAIVKEIKASNNLEKEILQKVETDVKAVQPYFQ